MMRLSWRDVVNTILAIGGGATVYAKYYNFSWALISSWRSAIVVLAVVGILMYIFSSFDFANLSILNVSEMLLGVGAVVLAITGMFVSSQAMFYSLAIVLGVVWFVDTARHLRHSIIGESGSTIFHHHAHVS